MKQKTPLIVLCFILLLSNLKYSYSSSLDENSLNKIVTPPPPPINDLCTGAIEVFGDGILDCESFSQIFTNDLTGTGDPEATGNCVSDTDPGVWFTFSTPLVMDYNAIYFAITPGRKAEIFSSTSGCSGLVYVDCVTEEAAVIELEEDTQYYILLGSSWMATSMNNGWIPPQTECDDPFPNSTPVHFFNVCETPSSLVPCENEYVHWRTHTTGCNVGEINIEVDIPDDWYPLVHAQEISIVAVLDDCTTLMSDYDPAGVGYVCSALGGETLTLQNVPPYTSFSIGFGSGLGKMGAFKISITSSTPGFAINDECSAAIDLITGDNTNLDNNCATQDNIIVECAPEQSQSSVWYIFDEGVGPQDISIEVNSDGIGSPALAVYDDCNGMQLGQNCNGSLLELYCVELPVYIEVSSTTDDEGDFDLNVISTPSPPALPAVVTSTDICSGSEANIDITIPNGELVTITIGIAPVSSSLISGMINQTVNGSSNTTIDDVLVNNSTTTQEAIYLITFSKTGPGCPPDPVEHSIFVFPSFITTTITIEECLPHLFEIDIDDIITGGSPPYNSISWYWNGTDPIGTGNTLSYDLTESGTITVEVVDNEGCTAIASIDVTTLTSTIPTFDILDEYCQSDQDFIAFTTISLEGIIGTWNPSIIDVSQITTTGYINATFTPNAFFCSEAIIQTILVYTGLESDFNLPLTLCAEGGIYVFPDSDLNGFIGSWQTPSIDLSTISGVQYNTFVVSTPGCFLDYEYEYEVVSSITLEFDLPESICKNATSITLNNISQQGYEGTWDISVIDPASTMDDFVTTTWSPLIGQSPCLSDTTITIAITDPLVPSFNLPDELCPLDSIFTFPTEDLQSVAGNWSIATIDPSNVVGTIVSEFTPDEDCASVFIWEIEITEPIIPVFDFDTLYCSLDSSFVLPTESDNGIQGIWSNPMINPSDLAGQELTVQFSGSMLDACIETIETVIYIEEAQDLEFDIADELCWTDENLLLPNTSLNGVLGSWEPSIIDIQSNIGQSINIEFILEIGFCFRTYTQVIEVLAPYIVDVNTIDPSGCNVDDGNITLEVQQGQNFEFSIDYGVNWQSTNMFDALNSGSYTILVRSIDNALCELTIDAYLNSTDGPIINDVVSTNINDCMTPNGSITIDAQGSNLEYSIDGINWQTTNVFEDLPEGNYKIEIRDALSDCIVVANAEIIDFPDTEITMVNTTDISDCNTSDGSIEIIAEGLALEYSIDNGITWSPSNIFTGLDAGAYEIITQSTEGINCTSSSEAVLIEPSLPIILEIEVESPTTCTPINGSLFVNADGNNIEYSIDGGITWQEDGLFSELSADEYQLIIREKENINCYTETVVGINIELDQLEESILQSTPTSDCDLEDGSIEIINSFTNLEYSIDTGATWQQTAFFDNLPSGFYMIISRKLEFPDCQVEQSIEVPILDCPCKELTIEAIADSISCLGNPYGSAELIKIEGMRNPGVEIQWEDGTQGSILEEVGEGWQIFTIKYDENCEWIDSVYIDKIDAIQFDWNIQDVGCEESNEGMIEVINISGGNGDYLFSLDGFAYQNESIFSELPPDTYEVFVYDGNDCITSEKLELESHEGIEISLTSLESILQGQTITVDPKIDASLIDSFSWFPQTGIINPGELIVSLAPLETTTYSLEIFYGECYAKKEITIEVLTEEEEEDIYIGNIFSPNGDNINDILYIQGSENSNIKLNEYKIYDRWGNMVFTLSDLEINNTKAGWDGYYQGIKMIPGVYVYTIDYTKNGASEVKIGTITLVW